MVDFNPEYLINGGKLRRSRWPDYEYIVALPSATENEEWVLYKMPYFTLYDGGDFSVDFNELPAHDWYTPNEDQIRESEEMQFELEKMKDKELTKAYHSTFGGVDP